MTLLTYETMLLDGAIISIIGVAVQLCDVTEMTICRFGCFGTRGFLKFLDLGFVRKYLIITTRLRAVLRCVVDEICLCSCP
jgi:hypothetical protein